MNGFWSTYRNPPKHSIAITTSLQRALQRSQAPCPTRRRLEMARQLAANATDTTARSLADRTIGEWWPGLTASNFVSDATHTAALFFGGEDDRRMDQPDRRGYQASDSRCQVR